jgi:hypothetical protein
MLLRNELVDFVPGQVKGCHVLGHVVTMLLFNGPGADIRLHVSSLCGVAMFRSVRGIKEMWTTRYLVVMSVT